MPRAPRDGHVGQPRVIGTADQQPKDLPCTHARRPRPVRRPAAPRAQYGIGGLEQRAVQRYGGGGGGGQGGVGGGCGGEGALEAWGCGVWGGVGDGGW